MSKNATGKEKFLEKMNTFDSAFEQQEGSQLVVESNVYTADRTRVKHVAVSWRRRCVLKTHIRRDAVSSGTLT